MSAAGSSDVERPVSSPERIVAIVPAHNESAAIASVVGAARRHLPVVVVDDGSGDDTAERARAAGAEVLRLSPNRGKGFALREGFRHALDSGWDAVVTLDADGQHDPSEIPTFLALHASSGAELVIGERDFRRMPPLRRLANSLGRFIFSRAVRGDIRDNQSGYRLIGRRLMAAMLESREAGFEFEVEMIVVCLERRLPLAWVPIRTIYAGERSHIDPWSHLVNFVRVSWHAGRRIRSARG